MEEALKIQEDEPVKIDWRERFYDVQTQSIKEDIRDLKDDVKRLDAKIDKVDAKVDGVREELLKEMKNLNDKINESFWRTLLGISIIMGIFTYLTK